MGQHLLGLGAVLLAEQVASGPLVFLPQDVVIKILKELELDRLTEPFGGFDAVDDDAAGASNKVFVEESHGLAEDPRQLRLPLVPEVGIEVATVHAAARPG